MGRSNTLSETTTTALAPRVTAITPGAPGALASRVNHE